MSEEFIDMRGQPKRELQRELALNYDLEQVVADLVDNSIDAGAENIEVIFNEEEYNGKISFYVIVVDDGKGIPDDEISSVMNFGAPREYDELELGKFGVGMKSSSLSQAKEVTLLSKVNGEEINLRRLSTEVVMEQDRWALISTLRDHMNTVAIGIAKRELSELNSGSAIVLEDMHKLNHRVGDINHRTEYLQAEYGHIREYLSLVFERYISGIELERTNGSKVHKKIDIFFNGKSEANKLQKLDPFCRAEKDGSITGTLQRDFQVPMDDGTAVHNLQLTIWITPNATDRGKKYDDRMDQASRFLGLRELQGLYIYRNQRLIDFPGWKKIGKVEEHMTCLRWELHFPSSLDEVFQLDPSKREIQLPRSLFDDMCKISRSSFRWHPEDSKSSNHRTRARLRQGGKDRPKLSPAPGPIPGSSTPTPTPGLPTPEPAPTPPPPQAVTAVKIKKLSGSITGQLFISEREEGSNLKITLNTKHALYQAFIDAMKKE